ncbi:hypothetical protein BKA64DRAFT_648394 [Cadophora sp. MPI-SDFR-AT-0126]|nr:hypothetical protein BKA64DRAFT_648394 [Leotiomycetes sp. MPI-SDFR-AT-0126]
MSDGGSADDSDDEDYADMSDAPGRLTPLNTNRRMRTRRRSTAKNYIGALHDNYDEPWRHMFGVNGLDVVSGIQRSGVVEPQPRSDAMAELGSGDAFVGNIDVGEFDAGYWAYVMNSRRDSAMGGSVMTDGFLWGAGLLSPGT